MTAFSVNKEQSYKIMNQNTAPLFEALTRYISDKAIAFHTPGHKQGRGIPPIMKEMITPLGLKMDVSLMSELDDLFEPTTCIKKAQQLAAELYGADDTLFMINGTTGAIHIMLLAALCPGDKIILPRNVHKSIMSAIILSGTQPIFVDPVINNELGIAMSVETNAIENAILKHPDAKAVLLVYPTYYGIACDIKSIAKLVHSHKMLLLVDEAHGPHLKFSRQLPIQSLDAGADISAQSTHKILTSLTQTSLLHVRYTRIKPERVKLANALIQSTSPNYILLASLDAARKQMAQNGPALLDAAIELSQSLRQEINKIAGLYCFGIDLTGTPGCFALDYTKITVNVKNLGISGYEAERILRFTYKIQCELADMYNVLFIISLADHAKETTKLLFSLQNLAKNFAKHSEKSTTINTPPATPPARLSPRTAAFAEYETIAFINSQKRICAETITFYPPGIPLIYPGEVISNDLIKYVKAQQTAGAKIVGPADAHLNTIRVIK